MVLSLADAAFVTTPTNALWNRAGAYPTLDLRFAENKSLVDAVTGSNLVTFTRASDATYISSDGLLKTATTNEPRFDHNPLTGESLGLLVEEQRTNLLLRSEEFDNASWLTFGTTVTANATIAPNGTTTADKLVNTTANAEHGIYQTTSTSGSNTFTVYAKQAELRYLVLRRDNTPLIAVYDLQSGTVTQTDAGVTAAITSFPNGWYRCSMTCSASIGTTVIKLSDVGTGVTYQSTYTGTAGQGIFIWGAQLEAGAFPTSYIPTTGSAATRAADVASITGSAFSSWYRQDEGTVFANWSYPVTPTSFPRIWQFTEGAAGAENGFSITTNLFNHNRFGAMAQNVALFDTQQGPDATVNQFMRSAMALKAGQHAYSGNGTAPWTNAGAMPSGIDRCWIGSINGDLFLTGHIRRLTYWPQRLPNATLQALTQ